MPGAVKSRRGYDSPRRREQAAETRLKILDAAGELFARDGYAAVAMPAIADRAGVALKTVYLAFGTKAGVLHGLWDVRLGGDDQPIPVTERPWYRELLEGDDPVVEWMMGSGMRPYLDALTDPVQRGAFIDLYRDKVAVAVPARPDGTTLFPFPRFFILARR